MNGRVTTADSWDSSRSIRLTHYKHTKEQRNNVNKATATASLSTAEIATHSDQTIMQPLRRRGLIDSGVSHRMCNGRCSVWTFKLSSLTVILLRDGNTVNTTLHPFVDVTQGYRVDVLYTPTCRLPFLSINQIRPDIWLH